MESDNKKHPFYLKADFSIEKNGHTFLGNGKLELLNNVLEEGSIMAASRKLKMSYQHAWQIINQINELSPLPILIARRGGNDGGGVEFTAFGKRLIAHLNQLSINFQSHISQLNKELDMCFL